MTGGFKMRHGVKCACFTVNLASGVITMMTWQKIFIIFFVWKGVVKVEKREKIGGKRRKKFGRKAKKKGKNRKSKKNSLFVVC